MSRTGHRRYRRNRALRLGRPDGDLCGICGHPGVLLVPEVDHVVPYALGGTDDEENLTPSHSGCNPCPVCGETCNQSKGKQLLHAPYVSREW